MGELVHHRQLRTPVQNRRDVQLREARILIGDHTGGKHFEIGELGSGRRAARDAPTGPRRCRCRSAAGRVRPAASRRSSRLRGQSRGRCAACPARPATHRVLYRSLSDQIRAVLEAGPGTAGHRWIHSDRVVRARPARPQADRGVPPSPDAIRWKRHMPAVRGEPRPEPGKASILHAQARAMPAAMTRMR